MIDRILAGAFNEGRFFKIYGAKNGDLAAWASPLGAPSKYLQIANQNLEAENFVRALEESFKGAALPLSETALSERA